MIGNKLEAHIMVPCEGCGILENNPITGGKRLKVNGPKAAKLLFLRPTPAIKCDGCGWHEPVEMEDVPWLLMQLTRSKDLRELFAWVAGRIVESEGGVK